jgi:transketolase
MHRDADPELVRKSILTIKFLAVDAVEKARSGHPGMPMGMAPAAYALWTRFLRHDPSVPDWPDRDRFVLSAGHGCMLQYALLHLSGYDVTLDDLKAFRQWESKTPGHPEFNHTPGVEATTGPLGQGVANAVGMALAAKMLAARFPTTGEGFRLVRHRVFAIASDGDLMEGVSAEASSLAGHLGLGDLVVLYDDNRITIEGSTDLAFSEDVCARYAAYGWHVQSVERGDDVDAIARALEAAIDETDRPSLIRCRTTIADGAPTKEGTAESHGSPLGPEETRAAKEALGWPLEPTFHVPADVRQHFLAAAGRGAGERRAWEDGFARWRQEHPDLARAWDETRSGGVPRDLTESLLRHAPDGAGATRAHAGKVLQQAARLVPHLVGGSADLAPSTVTLLDDTSSIARGELEGRNLHFGVREHAMGGILNGILYHGRFRPFGATFLVFSDYMRPSIRLAALSGLPAVYVFTHDSVFLGEDGPTHEPIEHAFALRLIPNLWVFRPADGLECALAWGQALERTDGPSALLLTRQKVPAIERTAEGELADPRRGGYRVVDGGDRRDVVLVATGSEVHLAVAAARMLGGEGRRADVVSMPCLERFLAQDETYRKKLLPPGVPIVTVEAGTTLPWSVLGGDALHIGIDRFGASAPAEVLAEKLGLTAEKVFARVHEWMEARKTGREC